MVEVSSFPFREACNHNSAAKFATFWTAVLT